MKIVAIYDRATEAYSALNTVNTRGEALRSFRSEANNKESMLNKFPSDYELWELADYNQQTGELVPGKERLARAEDMKEGN